MKLKRREPELFPHTPETRYRDYKEPTIQLD